MGVGKWQSSDCQERVHAGYIDVLAGFSSRETVPILALRHLHSVELSLQALGTCTCDRDLASEIRFSDSASLSQQHPFMIDSWFHIKWAQEGAYFIQITRALTT